MENIRRFRFYREGLLLASAALLALALAAGCGPTYKKGKIKESIEEICKKEYKIDVKTTTVGKTIGIYIPLNDLVDFTFAISKSASEKINDVILSVTRVAISTDEQFDFYCIIAHDVRIPEIQIVIIKSVDDVKRFLLSDVSRGEYSKRMIVDMRLNPQSQKEKTIKNVFEKMRLDPKWQEDVLNDFFRSEPSGLGDIGYWNEKFYLKDVTLAEFLAEQIASRIKIDFREDTSLAKAAVVKAAKGEYRVREQDGKRIFRIEFLALPKDGGMAPDVPGAKKTERMAYEKAVGITANVIHAYRFEEFDSVEIVDQHAEEAIVLSPADLENYRKKKLTFENIMVQNIVVSNPVM